MVNMIRQNQSKHTSRRDWILLSVGFSLRYGTERDSLTVPRSRSEHSYVGSTLSVLYATNNRTNNHPVRDVMLVETNDTGSNPACRRYATFHQFGRIPNGMRGSTVRIHSTHISSLTGWGEPVNRTIFRRALPYADVCKGFALWGNRKLATGTNDDAITATQYPFACYAGADLCGIPFFTTPYYTTSYYTVALGYCLHSCARYASGDTPHIASFSILNSSFSILYKLPRLAARATPSKFEGDYPPHTGG